MLKITKLDFISSFEKTVWKIRNPGKDLPLKNYPMKGCPVYRVCYCILNTAMLRQGLPVVAVNITGVELYVGHITTRPWPGLKDIFSPFDRICAKWVEGAADSKDLQKEFEKFPLSIEIPKEVSECVR